MENELGRKVDRCISDAIIKTLVGAGFGVVASFLFFKKRPGVLIFGSSFGLGMGVSNCNNDFKTPLSLISGKIVKRLITDDASVERRFVANEVTNEQREESSSTVSAVEPEKKKRGRKCH